MLSQLRLRIFASLALAAGVVLAGCTSDEHHADDDHQHDKVHIASAWVKAADEGMTAAFGVLHNDTASAITIESVSSPASDSVELHETVTDADHSSMMQEVSGGFTIDGGQNLVLEPGADHIMLMGIKTPLLPGDEVSFTLHFSDGSTQEFTAVIKEFDGAEESYGNHEEESTDHSSH